MDYKNLYTEQAQQIFKGMNIKPGYRGFVSFSKTIIQNENKFFKIFLGPKIIEQGNLDYYNKNYSSVDEGIQDAIKIINSIDNCITDYEYKPNYYLYLEQQKIDTYYRLHSKELINQFNNIEDYVVYYRDNIKRRYANLRHLVFNDYHQGNIMIDEDLNWTNIDHDGAIRYGINTPRAIEINLIKRRLGTQGRLVDYDSNYLQDIWENK